MTDFATSFFGTLLFQGAWAIRPETAETLWPVVAGIINGARDYTYTGSKETSVVKYAGELDDSDTFYKHGVKKQAGDVAIISVVGTMFKRAAQMGLSAGAGVSRVTRYVREAADDDEIAGIVVVWDTPGGTVDGTEDLHAAIQYAAGKKRVVSFYDGMCCSAGVWGSSPSTEIIAAGRTTEIGSIGVVMQHINGAGWLANKGYELEFLTNEDATHKVMGPPTRSLEDAEREELISKFLNPIGAMFQDAVIAGRGDRLASGQADRKLLFSGRVFMAEEAIKLGLVDRIGSLNDAVASARQSNIKSSNRKKSMSKAQFVKNLKANFLAFFNQEIEAASGDGNEINADAMVQQAIEGVMETPAVAALVKTNEEQAAKITALSAELSTAQSSLEEEQAAHQETQASLATAEEQITAHSGGDPAGAGEGDEQPAGEKKSTKSSEDKGWENFAGAISERAKTGA